jgi:hypothetical protein
MAGQLGLEPSYGSVPIRGQRPIPYRPPAPAPARGYGVYAPTYHPPAYHPAPVHEAFHYFAPPPAPFHHALAQAHQQVAQAQAHLQGVVRHPPLTGQSRPPSAEDQGLEELRRAFPHSTPLQRLLASASLQEARTGALSRARAIQQQQIARQRAGVGGPLDLGFVNITPLVAAATNIKVPGLSPVPLAGKLGNELLDLPGQSFLSGAMAGAATRQAIEGKPAGAEQIGAGILKQLRDPLGSLKEAPLATGLTLAGGEYGLMRALAAVGRRLPSEALKGALSTERPNLLLYGQTPKLDEAGNPITLPGGEPLTEAIAHEHGYNPDPLRKAIQVGYERALTKLPEPLRQQDPFVAEGWRLRKAIAGGKVRPGRYDREYASLEQARRQLVKHKTVPEAVAALSASAPRLFGKIRGRPINGEEAVPLIHTGEIGHVPSLIEADLRDNLRQLLEAQPKLKGRDLKANKAQVKQHEALLANKDFLANPQEAIDAAIHGTVEQQKPLTALEIHHGVLTEEKAARAPLEPYAVRRMGAVPHTEAMHAEAEAQALQYETLARARYAQLDPRSPEAAQALNDIRQAQMHRYEVSGRGSPAEQKSYEEGMELHQKAHLRVRELQEHLDRAERWRSELVGAHGAPRPVLDAAAAAGEGGTARDFGGNPAERAAALRGSRMEAADARIRGIKGELDEALKDERETREAVGGQPPIQPGLRTAEGKFLPNEEIEAHMRARGMDPRKVGFISHQQGIAGRGSFYKALVRPPKAHTFRRTGISVVKGTHDTSVNALVGQLADQASRIAQAEGWRAHITRYGYGEYDRATADAMEKAINADELPTPEAQAIRDLGGAQVVSKGTGALLERGQLETPRDVAGELERLGLSDYLPAGTGQPGKYTIIPKDIGARQTAHVQAAGARADWKRFAQAYTQAFRHVKFATSPKHFAGILEENLIRPIFESAGPVSYLAGRRFKRGLALNAETDIHGHINPSFGPEGTAARQLQGLFGGRGMTTSMRATDIVRKPEEATALGKTAELAGRSLPMKAWIAYRNTTETALRSLEHASQTAQLGKILQRTGFKNTWKAAFRTTDQAMAEEIRGRMTPNKADQVARALNNAAGNWNQLTPGVQAAVSTITPFGLWWLNSMRWVSHLPIEHPLKTAVLSSVYKATTAQRNAEGQGYQATGVGTREHPNYTQGTIPVNLPLFGEGLLDLGHYSPVGIGGPEAPTTAAEMIAPQAEGIIAGLQGTNPLTHEKATQRGGTELTGPQRILNAVAETAAGPTVLATQAQQLLQGGGKPYGTANLFTDIAQALGGPAQTKPGPTPPAREVILKLLNPLKMYKRPGGGEQITNPVLRQQLKEAEASGQRSEGSARELEANPIYKQEIKEAEEAAKKAGG